MESKKKVEAWDKFGIVKQNGTGTVTETIKQIRNSKLRIKKKKINKLTKNGMVNSNSESYNNTGIVEQI